MVVVLTVPALAGWQPIGSETCPDCGQLADVFPSDRECSETSVKCSFCGHFSLSVGAFPVYHRIRNTSTPATCTEAGNIHKECVDCHAVYTDTEPALGHTWTETSRTDATTTAPGSIEYTCSRCSDIKTETIPQLPSPPTPSGSMTMPQLLSTMTSVFNEIFQWIAAVSAAIASNPILLLCVVIGFTSTGVVLFRRLLNL